MSDHEPGEENLRKEFETLGKNLVEALRSAWEAPESRRFREEITTSLGDLGATLKREADELNASPAAGKVRASVEHVGEKLRAPDMQDKVRSELIGALQTVNNELQKVIERWSSEPAPAETAAPDSTSSSTAVSEGSPSGAAADETPADTNTQA